MDLSIIIVNWNVENLLRECLKSVYQYLPKRSFEIITVDNASTDGSIEMLKTEFPEVKIIENDENLGFSRAVNQAVLLGGSRNILLLNPDSQFVENSLNKLEAVFDKYPKVGIVGPQLLNSDSSFSRGAAGYFPSPLTIFNTAFLLYKLFPKSKWFRGVWLGNDCQDQRIIDWVSGACMLIRREVFNQIGSFNEKYFLFCEDMDFCYRAWQAGWKTYYLPQAKIIHHEGSSISQQDDALLLNYGTSLKEYLSEHYGRPMAFLLSLPLKFNYLMRFMVFGIRYLLHKTSANQKRFLMVKKHFRILL